MGDCEAREARMEDLRRASQALRLELPDAVWRDFNGRLETHLASEAPSDVGVVEGAAGALQGAKSLSVYYCPICKVGTGDRAWHPVGRAGLIPQTWTGRSRWVGNWRRSMGGECG